MTAYEVLIGQADIKDAIQPTALANLDLLPAGQRLSGAEVELVGMMAREGRLRGLAQTSLKRSPNIPEFPTVAESGYPGFEAVSWFGLFAPASTPPAVVNKLHQDVMKVLAQSDLRARFAQLGLDTVGSTPAELAAVVRNDVAKWTKVIKEAGITATN